MLEIRGLNKRFGALVAVNDIDMEVAEGAIHGLIGPNGSGKTTTMNLIGGTYRPTSGRVTLNGARIDGQSPHRIARMGVIRTFQLTRIYGKGTVFEAVRLGALAANGSTWTPSQWAPLRRGGAAETRAHEAIAQMGLEAHSDSRAGILPGGLQRILSIATALAAKPRLLLLDEPLAGLSAAEKSAVADRIELLRAVGVTILLVEHDVRSVMRLCDRITVINFGTVIATGSPAEISANDAVIEAYLGHRRPNANVAS